LSDDPPSRVCDRWCSIVATRIERSAGGVLCRNRGGSPWVALIVTRGGTRRQLPKGWLGEGETPEEAARREVFEETGLRGCILEDLGTIEYWFYPRRTTRVHKFVTFYLMAYESGRVSDFDRSEVDVAVWVPMAEAIAQVSFANEREILCKAQEAWPRYAVAQS
jgi:8-oxo-dGTP pyrophosphatase MutT (NUDIX family)